VIDLAVVHIDGDKTGSFKLYGRTRMWYEDLLGAFAATMPGQRLPFGLRPTTEGARGSDIIIEGIDTNVTVRLDGFTQS
jgi:hypothetical protein